MSTNDRKWQREYMRKYRADQSRLARINDRRRELARIKKKWKEHEKKVKEEHDTTS